MLREETPLTYQAATKDGYTCLSISGIYSDSPDRSEYFHISVEMTYILKDNVIVAWLYKETATSPDKEGYWNTTKYCIPLEEDIELVDEEWLASVCQ